MNDKKNKKAEKEEKKKQKKQLEKDLIRSEGEGFGTIAEGYRDEPDNGR